MSTTKETREKDRAHFQELVNKYNFEERYEHLLSQIQDVLEALGVMDSVTINTGLLGLSLLNYFEDIERLKDFELIEKANTSKVYSYGTFWLLRNKPIQIIKENLPYKYLHINEKVFTALLISKLLAEAGIDPDTPNADILSFMELLFYNFKYRIFTQKSLELMASAFLCGCKFAS